MITGLLSVGYFLTTIIFSLILFLFWIRILFCYYMVNRLHPIAYSIFRLTNPITTLFDRYLQTKNSRYDWGCLVVIIIIELIKFILLGLLVYRTMIPVAYLSLLVLADLIIQPCNLLFYALIFRIIMSWVNPQWSQHPAASVLNLITDPWIRLGRKIVPDISGFDFAPFVMMIIFKVITLFMSAVMPIPLI